MKYKKELSKLRFQAQDLYHKLDDADKKKFNLKRKLDKQLLTMMAFLPERQNQYEMEKLSYEMFNDALDKTIDKWESKYSNG